MRHNLEAMEDVVRFIYDNIQYAEILILNQITAMCAGLMVRLS